MQTQIADPVERLVALAEANTVAKEQSSAISATLLGDWFEIFGAAGRHARTTIGVPSLPGDAAVEVEGMFELH